MSGLICALHRDRRGYLPAGRKELYDAALSMPLSRRDRERGRAAPTGVERSDKPQIQLLQRLAYWLIRNGRTLLAEVGPLVLQPARPGQAGGRHRPLADLPLHTLGVSGKDGREAPFPHGLHRLRHLQHLVLFAPLPPEGPAALPVDAPLTGLTLGSPIGHAFARAYWPRLKTLQLRRATEDFAEEQWHALAHFAELESFSFGPAERDGALRIPAGFNCPRSPPSAS